MFVIVLMTWIACCRRNFGINMLTGTVPTELGRLTTLTYLCALRVFMIVFDDVGLSVVAGTSTTTS
jgi:hypothetical protein